MEREDGRIKRRGVSWDENSSWEVAQGKKEKDFEFPLPPPLESKGKSGYWLELRCAADHTAGNGGIEDVGVSNNQVDFDFLPKTQTHCTTLYPC